MTLSAIIYPALEPISLPSPLSDLVFANPRMFSDTCTNYDLVQFSDRLDAAVAIDWRLAASQGRARLLPYDGIASSPPCYLNWTSG